MLLNQNNLNVCKIASKSETRPELAGVFITKDKTVATDSFRLIEMSTPSNIKAEDYPKVQGKTAMRGFKPFIISAKELSKIKIPKNKSLPIVENIAISHVDNTHVELMTTDLETADIKSFRKIDGTFPDYEKIFPKENPKAEVELNAEYLAEVCEVLSKINNLKSVKIKFYGDNMPLVLEAKNQDQASRAMIMPLRK